jgi:hypothetical protein
MAKNILTYGSKILAGALVVSAACGGARAAMVLGPEQLVEADNLVITVPGYAAPSFIQWDGDNLPDLVVGEGGLGTFPGKVRIYINRGTPGSPLFTDFFYVQSEGTDFESPSGG